MADLRHEYVQCGKGGLFEELRSFLPGDAAAVLRPEPAARHAMSLGAVDVAVHRLRQRLGTLWREQAACTVSSADEVEEELRYLISVLST